MSKTGVAGMIGGIELPAIKLTFDGFRRGFISARPDGRVLEGFIGSFNDVGAAKEAALAQVSRGADMLFHDADAAGLGVFQAASQSPHVYAFGANRDQNEVPQAFLKLAIDVKAGGFRPGMIEFGMKQGMVRVVINPHLVDRIPAPVMALVKSAEQGIENGSIQPGRL
jgi:basic membrane lipoprotein Med (substrate-binding protein (PBP1-ABC) superfamily)